MAFSGSNVNRKSNLCKKYISVSNTQYNHPTFVFKAAFISNWF